MIHKYKEGTPPKQGISYFIGSWRHRVWIRIFKHVFRLAFSKKYGIEYSYKEL